MDFIKQIALEIAVIAVSVAVTFFIPGLGGLLLGGFFQLLGDIGIKINNNQGLDFNFFAQELLQIFVPVAGSLGHAVILQSKIFLSIEKLIAKVDKGLEKADNWLASAIEAMKSDKVFAMQGEELSPALKAELQEVEAQETSREALKDNVEITKRIRSIQPNTKNPDSPMAFIGFNESYRLGPREIFGELYFCYYLHNEKRVGYKLVPKSGASIKLGRTSDVNKGQYDKIKVDFDAAEAYKSRVVVFKNARYYGDYLASVRAKSWFGNYMRKWMIGIPGRTKGINGLILFGSVFRVEKKIQKLFSDVKELTVDPKKVFADQAQKYFKKTRFGHKLAKGERVFSKINSLAKSPTSFAGTEIKKHAKKFNKHIRKAKVKK